MVTLSPVEFPDSLLQVVLSGQDVFDGMVELQDLQYEVVFQDEDDEDDADDSMDDDSATTGAAVSDPEWLALVLGDSADLVGEAVDILFNARDRRLSVDIMELQKVVVEAKVVAPRTSVTVPHLPKAVVPTSAISTPATPALVTPSQPSSMATPLTASGTSNLAQQQVGAGAVTIKLEAPTCIPITTTSAAVATPSSSMPCPSTARPPSTPIKMEITTAAPSAASAIPPSPSSSTSSSYASSMMPVYQARGMVSSSSSCGFKTPVIPNDGQKRIGAYTVEERRLRIQKYLAKKTRRVWRKKIKYDCRKKLADNRPRIKGRFVKREEEEELEEHGAALQDDDALMSGLLTFEELLGSSA